VKTILLTQLYKKHVTQSSGRDVLTYDQEIAGWCGEHSVHRCACAVYTRIRPFDSHYADHRVLAAKLG